MLVLQKFQPKEKLQLNRGGSLACFRGPSLALRHFLKDGYQGWHTGAEWGESELKVQDILSRTEIPKLCKSFTPSTEPAQGPAHRGGELCTSSRQNKCAAGIPGQQQLDFAHI